MRLQYKLILIITAIILLQVIGVVYFNIQQTKNIVTKQLGENARNTAYTLAIALQNELRKDNIKGMELIARALYDGGEYKKIKIVRSDNKVIVDYEREKIDIRSVPDWFISAIDFKIPEASADLMLDWERYGTVQVQVSPGFSYISLWTNLKQIIFWVILINLASILFIIIVLHFLLKPMKKAVIQIKNLMLGEYQKQEKIPNTKEFKELVITTNQIGKRLEFLYQRMAKTNQKLQQSLYFIPKTPISNESYLEMRLNYLLNMRNEYIYGSITYLRPAQIDSDAAIEFYNEFYKPSLTYYGTFIAKYKEGILIVLPFEGLEQTKKRINQAVAQHENAFKETARSTLLMNGYWKKEDDLDHFLAAIDDMIKKTDEEYYTTELALNHSVPDIEQTISSAIKEKAIDIYKHPVYSTQKRGERLFIEAYMQIPQNHDKLISDKAFLKIAEKQQQGSSFDKMMIQKLVNSIQSSEETTLFSYSISEESLTSSSFLDWLSLFLQAHKKAAPQICLEVNEGSALQHMSSTKKLCGILEAYQAKFALIDFGRSSFNLTHLNTLPLAYLRLNGSFTVAIHQSKDNQQFIKEINYICSSLDIITIAVNVSSEEEIKTLAKLGTEGYSHIDLKH